ncbi:hypothetical protein T492DRAFT_1003875 [Pavlovales sp. CCMP2436]|nr:hypothetical protein T492DRAFT_1003875 [Pavlovales sp. CCMP2436]|mmetsp:Transcript_4458/g.11411  ORF Transcript_4458/g.11411 Transcript_4458/m.11411 type:complete len:189 (+) Transcript_4458:207-773(+)
MAAGGLVLERQWTYVATTLTSAELGAVQSATIRTAELPLALAFRREQREAMLQDDMKRLRLMFECEKAVPFETRRDDRIKKMQRLYGITTYRQPHAMSVVEVPGTSSASLAIPNDLEADDLIEWTQNLDGMRLTASPRPYDGISPPPTPGGTAGMGMHGSGSDAHVSFGLGVSFGEPVSQPSTQPPTS